MDIDNNESAEAAVSDAGALDDPTNKSNTEQNRMAPLYSRLQPPPRAAELQFPASDARLYWDRSHYSSPAEQLLALSKSSTLYVGNMAFTTRSSHLRTHFSCLGPVKYVVIGLDRLRKTPCGFGFVEYANRFAALAAVSLLSGTKLDGRVIRVELDAGFQPGRQYGRGVSGGQVRDDLANNKRKQQQQTLEKRKREQESSDSAPPLPPVNLDAALPSARPERMEEDDNNEPAAKRQKR